MPGEEWVSAASAHASVAAPPSFWPEPPGPRCPLSGGLQRACKLTAAAGWLLRGASGGLPPAPPGGSGDCGPAPALADHHHRPAAAPPPAAECGPSDRGLDAVGPGLFISSGRAAARLGALRAAGVTHVVNAAPSVELCWHEPQLVRGRARAGWWGEAQRSPGVRPPPAGPLPPPRVWAPRAQSARHPPPPPPHPPHSPASAPLSLPSQPLSHPRRPPPLVLPAG